jgi:hypothetical protein
MTLTKPVANLIIIIAPLVCLSACFSPAGVEDPVPKQIQNLAMGAHMTTVKEMINGSGEMVTGASLEKRGPQLTWTPASSPYYRTIDFDFTEKDRLYMIRYNLKEAPRETYQGVKQGFFNLYKFDPDEQGPSRIRVRGNDALLYDHPENSNTFLFEITDKRTGNKSIELFERSVSAQDRPPKKSAEVLDQEAKDLKSSLIDKRKESGSK